MTRIVIYLVVALMPLVAAQTVQAQEKSAATRVAAAAERLNKRQTYELKYKFKKGEKVRWSVEHVASTKIQMEGETEESSSRSVTQKCWSVRNVDVHGNITFVHSIEAINAWQKVGEEKPVKYNSRKDAEAPEEYKATAEQLNKPLAVFSIKPDGSIIDRKSPLKESTFGVGKVTIPLPAKPVALGSQWQVPTLLNATDEMGNQKKLKARILYQLTKVRGPLASIKFKTEVLTPVRSQKVKSTIMQQMTEGTIVFDIKQGRPVAKQVEWDEKAVGFEGGDSMLKYVGKMTEKLIVQTSGPSQTGSGQKGTGAQPAKIKTSDAQPLLRAK